MIIDSSAIVAIIADEPEAERFTDLILRAPVNRMSAGTEIELAAVGIRRGIYSLHDLRRLTVQLGIVVEPVTAEQAQIGQDAYARYGIGTGDPAKLNFGDCFSYALAKALNEPLLYKGDDFSRTDVASAA